MKTTLAEIRFALKNGFTEIKRGIEKDGSVTYQGTFGYVAVTPEEAKQINALINEYVTVKKTESELLQEWESKNGAITVVKEVTTNIQEFEGLTEKESQVLQAIIDNSYEFGLPVDVDTIKDKIKMSKRSIVGVVSSLYKKEYVTAYEAEEDLEEFMLTEEIFKKYVN